MKKFYFILFLILFQKNIIASCDFKYNSVINQIDKALGYTGIDHVKTGVCWGTPVVDYSKIPLPVEGASAFYLGKGFFGNVYRYVNKEGYSLNVKYYPGRQGIDNDIRLIKVLQSLIKDSKTTELLIVNYVELTNSNFHEYLDFFNLSDINKPLDVELVIITPSVKGNTVKNVGNFVEKQQAINIQNYIEKIFRKFVSNIEKNIFIKPENAGKSIDLSFRHKIKKNKATNKQEILTDVFILFKYKGNIYREFNIPARNMLLDRNHNLWVIDPY